MVKVSRSTRASSKRSTVSRKLLQWNCVWKPRMRAAEQAVEQLLAPRADGEGLGIGPGNVPERDDGRARQALAHHARQQREVIVLHQHDRVVGARLVGDDVGEALVDVAVMLPVVRAERRARVGDVAQRPQALVGEAVVVALLLLLRQPHPADPVGGMLGRHHHVVVLVDRVAVGVARAVRDPGARGRRASIGSSAVTRPLAGRWISITLSLRRVWM